MSVDPKSHVSGSSSSSSYVLSRGQLGIYGVVAIVSDLASGLRFPSQARGKKMTWLQYLLKFQATVRRITELVPVWLYCAFRQVVTALV